MLDLVLGSDSSLTENKKEYFEICKIINDNLPLIKKDSSNFGKHQSQFMDNVLTVSHLTPARNARQVLAELNRILDALKEAQYNLKKKDIKIRKLQSEILSESNEFTIEEKELEIQFEKANIESSKLYVEGAIRQCANYMQVYNGILQSNGIEKLTEEIFEKEEEKYHISKAFEQALCAARSRSGVIDEGNHIYFSQIGINGTMAQNDINEILKLEREALSSGRSLNGKFITDWLEAMCLKYEKCSEIMLKVKGIEPCTQALLKS